MSILYSYMYIICIHIHIRTMDINLLELFQNIFNIITEFENLQLIASVHVIGIPQFSMVIILLGTSLLCIYAYFLPIMLCFSAQNLHLLCSILCSCERLVLKF